MSDELPSRDSWEAMERLAHEVHWHVLVEGETAIAHLRACHPNERRRTSRRLSTSRSVFVANLCAGLSK